MIEEEMIEKEELEKIKERFKDKMNCNLEKELIVRLVNEIERLNEKIYDMVLESRNE